jgi:hypothetical protein
MDLDHAIEAHRQWKVRLRMFINGTSAERLDPAAVAKDNQCDLGKWIHGPATAYASRPCYVALKGAHAEFHASAARVVTKAVAGDTAGAEGVLSGAYA